MVSGARQGPGLRYTWGDLVLTAVPLAGIVYAALLAGGLSREAERSAERIFWGTWLVGAMAGGAAWAWYGRHPDGGRSDPRTRKAVIAIAPFLGVGGLVLANFAPNAVRFGFLGAGSGFMLAVMVGYAIVVRRQRSGHRNRHPRPPG